MSLRLTGYPEKPESKNAAIFADICHAVPVFCAAVQLLQCRNDAEIFPEVHGEDHFGADYPHEIIQSQVKQILLASI